MAQPLEQWITDIPPVTRVWVAAAVGTSILVVSLQSTCLSHIREHQMIFSNARLIHRNAKSSLLFNYTSPGTPRCTRCRSVLPFVYVTISRNTVAKGHRADPQVWRFFTTFCFFGRVSLDLAFHLFFMCVLCSDPQSLSPYHSRQQSGCDSRSDQLWTSCAGFS